MPERETSAAKISRRKMLKYSAAGLVSLGLTAAGVRVVDNETQGRTIPRKELLEEIEKRKEKPFYIGVYPDYRKLGEDGVGDRLEKIRQEVGCLDMVGLFTNLEAMQDEESFSRLLERLEFIHNFGAIPIISATTSWPYNEQHPFHKDNESKWQEISQNIAINLSAFPHELYARFLYEANLSNPKLTYSLISGISPDEYLAGFRETWNIFQEQFAKHRPYPTVLAPSLWFPVPLGPRGFSNYLFHPEKTENSQVSFAFGVEGYNFCPGPFAWTELIYWIAGNPSPEEIFCSPLEELQEHFGDKIPFFIWEVGCAYPPTMPIWIKQAGLVAMAGGATGMVLLDVDQSERRASGHYHEADWTMNNKTMAALRELSQLVARPPI